MRVVKPNWVKHTDEKDRKSPIFSISVHPDGTRLATGGLDKKVKIWSTVPILDHDAEQDESNHKLLCTMSSHNGSVLTVRWSHHGRFLASGSDDTCIVIWGIDPSGGGKVFGSSEVNVENWKALTRLVGHTADIIDVAWSRDDSMMASVGLDKSVWIWDGGTFEKIRKLDSHDDFVKGVTWDPVGAFLATQSDDKTVKIWETKTWTCVQSVAKPFENSPKSTFFRRLSWSPDGAFIAASNAMNGPVFVAAVIEREGWNADISFVGHANTIQVAAFNPRLFFREGDAPGRATASCMVALGADDFSISIWRNTLHKPLTVLQDIFNRPLLDLCWANDGHTLYGCSADGTICAISFLSEEFPELASLDKTEVVLREYGYTPKIITRQPSALPNSFGTPQTNGGTEHKLTAKKGVKRLTARRRVDLGANGFNGPSASGNAFSSAPIQPFAGASQHQASTARMFETAHAAFANGSNEAGPSRGTKRKASEYDNAVGAGITMGSAIPRSNDDVREIRAPTAAMVSSGLSGGRSIPPPPVQTVLRAKPQDSAHNVYLEARNAENAASKNKVIYVADGEDQWVDYLPTAALVIAVSDKINAVACEDGTLIVYSAAGRRLNTSKLTSPVVNMAARGYALAVVTSDCCCQTFDMRSGQSPFPPTSIAGLLGSSSKQGFSIATLDVRARGVPVIITSEPAAYVYDSSCLTWTLIASAWWSNVFASHRSTVKGPLSDIEDEVAQLLGRSSKAPSKGKDDEWFDEAMELGMYDMRIKAAELLGSKEEYQHWLGRYAGALGRLGFQAKAEEVIKDLLGPRYRQSGDQWQEEILGIKKRDLAKLFVQGLAQGQLAPLARQYIAVIREVEDEESS